VDDGSTDGTSEAARAAAGERQNRLEILRNAAPLGVGAAIVQGYLRAIELDADVAVVLAGDAQMDPSDLAAVIAPVLEGRADYVKGNRFLFQDGMRAFPAARLLGVAAFSVATRLATGLPVSDTQCGYTAIGRRALSQLDWSRAWTGYGYPNALLVRLARLGLRVAEVPVRPIYADEQSKLRPRHLPPIAAMLGREIVRRATEVTLDFLGGLADTALRRYVPARVAAASEGPPGPAAGTAPHHGDAGDARDPRDLREPAGGELVRRPAVHLRPADRVQPPL
jgi:glycosyltransferase involved in cell wall biosynthesis